MPSPSTTWPDVLAALEFTQGLFERWRQEGVIHGDQYEAIAACYQQDKADAARALQEGRPVPSELELPPPEPETDADESWFLRFRRCRFRIGRFRSPGTGGAEKKDKTAKNKRRPLAHVRTPSV